MSTVAVLAAAGAFALSGPAQAKPSPTTLYVSKGGANTDGCGGIDQKCLTIQFAINKANSGDTVQVSAGDYAEGVTIDKGITLIGAGAATTAINGHFEGTGTGVDPGPNGLVDIQSPGADVTISGFTIENPFIGTVAGPYTMTMTDPSADDHITISDNTIKGSVDDPDAASNAPLGIDSANTLAQTTITGNDISGVWQGVLLEGNQGPLDVSNNHFHALTPLVDGGSKFTPEGVYVLSDKDTSATGQNVTDNIFDGYAGIGIAYSAGYNSGGCSGTPCGGSVAGAITGNRFDLTANDPDFTTASAIRLRAFSASDELDVTLGGNTGTVAAPTKTIEETPNNGVIAITPTSTPDTITPTPTPTLDANVPASITTGAAPMSFTGTATNPANGDDIAHARYDITLTGTSGITAEDITLQYRTGSNDFATVPLSGSATSGSAITGFFGPAAGFPFPSGPGSNATDFKLSVPSADAKTGPLASTVSLDEVSAGSGHPIINTLVSDSSTVDIVASQPTIADHANSTTSGKSVAVAVPNASGEHGPFTYTHGTAAHGTVTGSGQALTYTPAAGFAGTDTFTYTATDANDATAVGTETVTVTAAASSLSVSVSPSSPTSANVVSAKVTVTTTGDPTGGTVTVKAGGKTVSGTVVNKKVTIKLIKFTGGSHSMSVSFKGTDSATSSTATKTFTVAKVKTTLQFSTRPSPITNKTAGPKAVVGVTSTGANSSGATVKIMNGTKLVGSGTVSHGQVVIALPKLSRGSHKFQVVYSGTATSKAKTRNVTVLVRKA